MYEQSTRDVKSYDPTLQLLSPRSTTLAQAPAAVFARTAAVTHSAQSSVGTSDLAELSSTVGLWLTIGKS